MAHLFVWGAPVGLNAERDALLGAAKTGFAGRLEVVRGPSGWQRWPDDVKTRVVADSFRRGARVADAARAHGATRGRVYQWRMLARRGLLVLPGDDEAPLDLVTSVDEVENPGVAGATTVMRPWCWG